MLAEPWRTAVTWMLYASGALFCALAALTFAGMLLIVLNGGVA